MSHVDVPLRQLPAQRRFGETSRRDRWWLTPVAVFLGLSAFIVYSTWAAFQGVHYHFAGGGADYLSPFYSPVLFDGRGVTSGHAWFGPAPSWWPEWLVFSPAFLILWAPGGFRFTCYYYRGAYYKAFWADPPSCAVGEPRKGYLGEKSFPLVLQNVHRYFMYIAVGFLVFLSYDAWRAMWFDEEAADGTTRAVFGVGVGTLVLIINPILLGGYTLGCHSLRHILGGRRDRLSANAATYNAYKCVTCLNKRHMVWAWISLFWVGFTDFYVRMCSMGVFTDWRIF